MRKSPPQKCGLLRSKAAKANCKKHNYKKRTAAVGLDECGAGGFGYQTGYGVRTSFRTVFQNRGASVRIPLQVNLLAKSDAGLFNDPCYRPFHAWLWSRSWCAHQHRVSGAEDVGIVIHRCLPGTRHPVTLALCARTFTPTRKTRPRKSEFLTKRSKNSDYRGSAEMIVSRNR